MMKVHPESVHGVRCEPNFKVFYRKEGHTDAEYMSFPEIKGKTNVHNVHDVHADRELSNSVSLDSWYFSDNQAGFEAWWRLFGI